MMRTTKIWTTDIGLAAVLMILTQSHPTLQPGRSPDEAVEIGFDAISDVLLQTKEYSTVELLKLVEKISECQKMLTIYSNEVKRLRREVTL